VDIPYKVIIFIVNLIILSITFWCTSKKYVYIIKKTECVLVRRSFLSTVNPWESYGPQCIIIAACQEKNQVWEAKTSVTVLFIFSERRMKQNTLQPSTPPFLLSLGPPPPPTTTRCNPDPELRLPCAYRGVSFEEEGDPSWLWQICIIFRWIMIMGNPARAYYMKTAWQ
jgi:hypothetical protein